MSSENPNFLKIDQAAEFIHVSPWTIRKWINERKLRSYRFGGAIRIRLSDLLSFADVTICESEIKNIVV